ncbi:hypothetical protein MMC13_007321 [Lambiella insularis]|nr:hypothetical protein [Lambiella insularis]
MGEVNSTGSLRRLSLSYNSADSHTSALRLVLALFPDWEYTDGEVEFVRFKDGITNTLFKAIKRRPGFSEEQIDEEAVLLRAYGSGTEVLIDRERESASHFLLAHYKLAPPPLARFQNGLMYRFIRGRVCQSHDLSQQPVWRGVARRLAEWHALLPLVSTENTSLSDNEDDGLQFSNPSRKDVPSLQDINAITPFKHTPNIWTVIQKWIFALPTRTPAEVERKTVLQKELKKTVIVLGDNPGLGKDGLVVGHCDLLSGNVIIQPSETRDAPDIETVSFIDYEYTTPCPAAFDLANHFAEWGGFECDYSVLPTRSTRRDFLHEYLASYHHHLTTSDDQAISPLTSSEDTQPAVDVGTSHAEVSQLLAEVDRFRGIPGLYWGVWALIQATISQIDFPYAEYAETRLQEYWDWRAAEAAAGTKKQSQMGERELRWAQE